jgi:hypothetical protein
VRKLGIRQPLTALYQRVSRLAWIEGQRLQSAGAQGPSEGRSAELGLALVLLMCASGSRDRQIIATGALGSQPHGVLQDDVEILPVGSLPAKLRLVSTLARHQGLPGIGTRGEVLFFTPRRFERDGEWQDVESLAEVGELKAQGVRVVPVGRLSEAAAELKALRARHLVHDRVAQALVAGLLLIACTGYAWSALQQRPIVMAFLPGGGTALVPEPYRVCFTKDGGFYPSPLGHEGLARSIPAGETLGWRVRIGAPEDGGGLAGWFRPERYYVAQVMVSEHSQAKVMVPQLAGNEAVTVPPGGIWEWGWQLNDQPENNGLVLLAKAEAPFDPDALRAELIKEFPPAAGGDGAALDVTAAINFIAGKAPGAAKFIIQTVERSVPCTP